MVFDLKNARKEFSDEEIISFLAEQHSFDVEGARNEGLNDNEIISFLSEFDETPVETVGELKSDFIEPEQEVEPKLEPEPMVEMVDFSGLSSTVGQDIETPQKPFTLEEVKKMPEAPKVDYTEPSIVDVVKKIDPKEKIPFIGSLVKAGKILDLKTDINFLKSVDNDIQKMKEKIALEGVSDAFGVDPSNIQPGLKTSAEFVEGSVPITNEEGVTIFVKKDDDSKILFDKPEDRFEGKTIEKTLPAELDLLKRQKKEAMKRVGDFLKEQQREKGVGELIVEGVTELPAFMIEFALTGGLAEIGKKSVTKAINKTLSKKMVKDLSENIIGKGLIETAKLGAGAALRTPAMVNRVVESATRRTIPRDMILTDKGLEIIKEGDSVPEAIFKGIGDVYIELFSEEAGELIGKTAGVVGKKILNKFPGIKERLVKISDVLYNKFKTIKPNVTKSEFTKKILKKGGFNGILNEMGEERLGDTLRVLTGVTSKEDLGLTEDDSIIDALYEGVIPNGKQLLVEAGIFAVPGSTAYVVQNLMKESVDNQKKVEEQRVEETDEKISDKLTPEEQTELNTILNKPAEERTEEEIDRLNVIDDKLTVKPEKVTKLSAEESTELNNLLNIPEEQRTDEQNDRIIELDEKISGVEKEEKTDLTIEEEMKSKVSDGGLIKNTVTRATTRKTTEFDDAGNVIEVEKDIDDLDLELENLERKHKKGKLTTQDLIDSTFGRQMDTSELNALKANEIDFILSNLREKINKELLSQTSQEKAEKPVAEVETETQNMVKQEVDKYDTAEDFINSIKDKRIASVEQLMEDGYTKEQAEFISNNINDMMDMKSPSISDILNNENDYERLEKNPITIYRVVPKGKGIEIGDFVFTDKQKAEQFRDEFGFKRGQPNIVSSKVDASDLIFRKEQKGEGEMIFLPESLSSNEKIKETFDNLKEKPAKKETKPKPKSKKVSQFKTKTLAKSGIAQKLDLKDSDGFQTERTTREEQEEVSAERLKKDFEGERERLTKEGIKDDKDVVTAKNIINALIKKGDPESIRQATELTKKLAPAATKGGQLVESFKAFQNTPEGALLTAEKAFQEAQGKMGFKMSQAKRLAKKLKKQLDAVNVVNLEDVINEIAKELNFIGVPKVDKLSQKEKNDLKNKGGFINPGLLLELPVKIIESGVKKIKNSYNSVKNTINEKGFLEGLREIVFGNLKKGVLNLKQIFKNVLKSIPRNIKNVSGKLFEKTKKIFNTLKEFARKEGRELFEKMGSPGLMKFAETSRTPEISEEAVDKASKNLANKIINHVKKTTKKNDPIKNMVNELFNISKKTLPKKQVKSNNALDFIVEAITNRDKYEKTFIEAKNKVLEKIIEQGEGVENLEGQLEEFKMFTPEQFFSDKKLEKVIQQEGITSTKLNEIVKDWLTDKNEVKTNLAKTIVEKSKLTGEQAKQLEKAIFEKFDKMLGAKKEKILETILTPKQKQSKTIKTELDKVIELHNLGALKNEDMFGLIAPKLNIPVMTNELAGKITKRAEKISTLPENSRERIVEEKLLLKDIKDEVPTPLGQKISTLQTMAQLFNLKTMGRNIISNAGFAGVDSLTKDFLGVPIDMLLSMFTGKRSLAFTNKKEVQEFVDGFKQGLKKGTSDVWKGIDTLGAELKGMLGTEGQELLKELTGNARGDVLSQYEIADAAFKGKTLPGKFFKFLEQLTGIGLKATDRAFFEASFKQSLENQKRAAGTKNHTAEMVAQAIQEGLVRTYQDFNKATEFFTGLKGLLNKVPLPFMGGKWGIGDLILKYPKTPANLLMRAIEYSPAGIMKSLGSLIQTGFFNKKFNQRQFATEAGRNVSGTAIWMLGYALFTAGLVTGKPDENRKKSDIEKAIGKREYSINISGLRRWVASGFKKEAAQPQKGDTWFSYDWVQPLSIAFSGGVEAGKKVENTDDENKLEHTLNFMSFMLDSAAAGADNLAEQPLVKGLQRSLQKRSVGEMFIGMAENAPGSFVPSLLGQLRYAIDPQIRDTRDKDKSWYKRAMNIVKNKIPGLSEKLPAKKSVLGKEFDISLFKEPKNNFERAMNVLSVFVNPTIVSEHIESDEIKFLRDLVETTGETRILPKNYSNTKEISYGGKKIELTIGEMLEMQEEYGKLYEQMLKKKTNDPRFMSKSAGKQADDILRTMRRLSTKVRMIMFRKKRK